MKQNNGKAARLPENPGRAVMNAAKALPRVGKGVALGVLLAAATLTLSRCSSPTNGPGYAPPPGPGPGPAEDTTPTITINNQNYDIEFDAAGNIQLKDSANAIIKTLTLNNGKYEFKWEAGYQGQVPSTSSVSVDSVLASWLASNSLQLEIVPDGTGAKIYHTDKKRLRLLQIT
jgi:hypothetical protein